MRRVFRVLQTCCSATVYQMLVWKHVPSCMLCQAGTPEPSKKARSTVVRGAVADARLGLASCSKIKFPVLSP